MLPFELIKDTPYLALSGELWSVFYEYFNRNWSCYRGFILYISLPDYNELNRGIHINDSWWLVAGAPFGHYGHGGAEMYLGGADILPGTLSTKEETRNHPTKPNIMVSTTLKNLS